MEPSLFKALIEEEPNALIQLLVDKSPQELEAMRELRDKEGFPAELKSLPNSQRAYHRLSLVRVLGLDPEKTFSLHSVPWEPFLDDMLIEVVRRSKWPKVQLFVDHAFGVKSLWWVAFCLVEEGVAKIPDTSACLRYLPWVFVGLRKRIPVNDLLQRPLMRDLIRQLLENPTGTISSYTHPGYGLSLDVPQPGKKPNEICVGYECVRYIMEQGDPVEIEALREMMFASVVSVEGAQAAGWICGLSDHVLDDAVLLEWDLSEYFSHPEKRVQKWVIRRTKDLVKSGAFPLAEYVDLVLPVLGDLAKGTVGSLLEAFVNCPLVEPEDGPAVAKLTVQSLNSGDAKIQETAIAILTGLDAADRADVEAELLQAKPLIKATVRRAYLELCGGEAARPAEAKPFTAVSRIDPKRLIQPIQTVKELLEVATQVFVHARSARDYLRVVDAMCRLNGQVKPDAIPPLGDLRKAIATALYVRFDWLRSDWNTFIGQLAALGYDTKKLAPCGPRGSGTYDKKLEDQNSRYCDRTLKLWPAKPKDFRGPMTQHLAACLVRWFGLAPFDQPAPLMDPDLVEYYEENFKRSGGHVGAKPGLLETPFERWMSLVRERLGPDKAPFHLMSTPTHGDWLAPSVLVDRLASTNEEVTPVDLAMALLRLAPEGREAALEEAKKLKHPFAGVLRYALGGTKPRGKVDPECLACARLSRSPDTEQDVEISIPDLCWNRSEYEINEQENDMALLEVELAEVPPSTRWANLPDYVHAVHRRRIPFWHDGRGGSFEPLYADWYLGLMPIRLDLTFANALSLYASLSKAKTIYVHALAEVMYDRLGPVHAPLPDSAYCFLALNLGMDRPGTRDPVPGMLIAHAGDPDFEAERIGHYFAWFLECGWGDQVTLATCPHAIEILAEVAAEGGGCARIVGAIVLGVIETFAEDPPEEVPHRLNGLIDLLASVRQELTMSPLSDEVRTWLQAFPGRGAIGKSSKALLAV